MLFWDLNIYCSLGAYVMQGGNSPWCCREPWHRDVGRSAAAFLPLLCICVGAVVAVPACLQPPGDESCRFLSSLWNEGDDKRGGINPLRAQEEIMREIWLFCRSYAISSNTAHIVWGWGSLLYIYLFIFSSKTALDARGSVTDGKSSFPLCWFKKTCLWINNNWNERPVFRLHFNMLLHLVTSE